MVKPLYDKPPKHVTDMFLCKNWSSLAYENESIIIDPTLKPTKCKPATDPSSDEDIIPRGLRWLFLALTPLESVRRIMTQLRTAAYDGTLALAPSLVKNTQFVPDIVEPAVRNGRVEINVTSALTDYEQEQEHERDEEPWSGSHNRKKENIQTIAGLEGNRWTKHLAALLGLNDKELELKKTLYSILTQVEQGLGSRVEGHWLSGEGSETTDWESSSPSTTSSSLLSKPKCVAADMGLTYMPGTSRMNTLHVRSSQLVSPIYTSGCDVGKICDCLKSLKLDIVDHPSSNSDLGSHPEAKVPCVKDEQQETWVMRRARNSIIVMLLRLEKYGGEQGMKETLHVIELWDNLQEERSCFEGSETL
ncbi:hypothetical protein JB92DRAFT_3239937 [Gautieria morchelliformis]|nr:hypothetical protein JB92DRAFT_3239937 [Gautieria morchelliformis]